MPPPLVRSLISVFLLLGVTCAQELSTSSADTTLQSLLKEVHALRRLWNRAIALGPGFKLR